MEMTPEEKLFIETPEFKARQAAFCLPVYLLLRDLIAKSKSVQDAKALAAAFGAALPVVIVNAARAIHPTHTLCQMHTCDEMVEEVNARTQNFVEVVIHSMEPMNCGEHFMFPQTPALDEKDVKPVTPEA